MPLKREDPKVAEAVALLPANGSAMNYADWKQAMITAGRNDLVRIIGKVRDAGVAVFEIGDMNDPVATHTVRRAAAAAPASAPVAVPPVSSAPGA